MAYAIEKSSKQLADFFLVISILLFAGIGFVTYYSASNATQIFPNGNIFADGVSRQITCEFIGIFLFFLTSRFNWEILRRSWMPVVILLFIVLLGFLPKIPVIGNTINGASRWATIGFRFQPSEFLKILLPFYFAHLADKKQERINNFFDGLLPLGALIVVVLFCLAFVQSDLSTAVLIGVNLFLMYIFAGGKRSYIISAGIALVIIGILFIINDAERVERVKIFLDSSKDTQDSGYQINQAQQAVRTGSFWGTGLGQRIEEGAVPESRSDFIFSYYAKRCGFVGVFFFFVLFGIFAFRAYVNALRAGETFRRLFGIGITTMIVTQVIMSVAVTAGALPVTGITLPFFSAGGTSLIVTFAEAGILVNISRIPHKNGFPDHGGIGLNFSVREGGWS
ncbi:cell division protein FtsW [Spirochaetia bacterium]|nr:cell division protein FtsW [Spirochaetia bacterium]